MFCRLICGTMSSVDIGELHLLLIIFTDGHCCLTWTLVSGRGAAQQITWNTGEAISFYWYVDRFFVFMPINDKKKRQDCEELPQKFFIYPQGRYRNSSKWSKSVIWCWGGHKSSVRNPSNICQNILQQYKYVSDLWWCWRKCRSTDIAGIWTDMTGWLTDMPIWWKELYDRAASPTHVTSASLWPWNDLAATPSSCLDCLLLTEELWWDFPATQHLFLPVRPPNPPHWRPFKHFKNTRIMGKDQSTDLNYTHCHEQIRESVLEYVSELSVHVVLEIRELHPQSLVLAD